MADDGYGMSREESKDDRYRRIARRNLREGRAPFPMVKYCFVCTRVVTDAEGRALTTIYYNERQVVCTRPDCKEWQCPS